MEHYAAILNLEDADSYCLQQDELFDHEVQGTVSRSILLGHGQTEHAALTVALNTLQDNGMLKTYKCEFGADGILKSGSGREALRHLWLYDKKKWNEPKTLPFARTFQCCGFLSQVQSFRRSDRGTVHSCQLPA